MGADQPLAPADAGRALNTVEDGTAWPLHGARVRLRRLAQADLPAFQAYRRDPEVGRWQGWQPQADAEAAAFLAEMAALPFCPAGAWCQIAIADIASDALLGDIGLHLAADGTVLDIGYTLARAAQGRGLATEAVGLALAAVYAHTPARRVRAVVDLRNTASLRLLQRLHFCRLVTLDAVFRGQPCQEQTLVHHRPGRAAARLRPAQAADAPAVARVLIDSRAALMPYAPSVHSDDETRAWVAGVLLPGGGVTVAEVDGAVQGVLAVAQRGAEAWIDQLYVAPDHAGAGLGSQLLALALRVLPRPVRLYTFKANLAARAFYERRGWRALHYGDGRGNEEGCPDVLYGLDADGP